jgi:hypothetical protein
MTVRGTTQGGFDRFYPGLSLMNVRWRGQGEAAKLGVLDLVHRRPSAQLLDDAVVRDGLAEQKGETLRPRANMLGVRQGQVNGRRRCSVRSQTSGTVERVLLSQSLLAVVHWKPG